MSNQLAVQGNTDLIEFDDSKLDLIKRTIAPTATPDELELFLHQCRRTGLDPLAKQIYFQKFNGKMAIVTGIDGYRLIATRTKLYAGNDEPKFDGRIAITDRAQWDKITHAPAKATMTVKRIVGGVACDFTATAYWEEFYPGGKRGGQWRKMPHVMLSKIAEAAALRKAFPADLSGIYTSEEMEQAQIQTIPTPPHRRIVQETGEIVEDIFDGEIEEEPPFVPDEPTQETAVDEPRTAVDIAADFISQAAGNDGKPTDPMLKKMQKDLGKTCGSNANAKKFLKSVFNVNSSTECTFGQVKVLLDWIGSTGDNGWKISPIAIEEAKTVLENKATM